MYLTLKLGSLPLSLTQRWIWFFSPISVQDLLPIVVREVFPTQAIPIIPGFQSWSNTNEALSQIHVDNHNLHNELIQNNNIQVSTLDSITKGFWQKRRPLTIAITITINYRENKRFSLNSRQKQATLWGDWSTCDISFGAKSSKSYPSKWHNKICVHSSMSHM